MIHKCQRLLLETTLVAALLCTLESQAAIQATTTADMQRPSVAQIDDHNEDGISREELQGRPRIFDRNDASRNRFVAQVTRKKAEATLSGESAFAMILLKFLDTDANSRVSHREFLEITRLFDLLDKNNDMQLTTDEFAGFFDVMQQGDSTRNSIGEPHDLVVRRRLETPASGANQAKPILRGEREEGPFEVRNGPHRVPLFAVRLLNFLDTDSSAKLSREEFGELVRLFNSLDTDHDELLSTKELCHFFDAPNEASL